MDKDWKAATIEGVRDRFVGELNKLIEQNKIASQAAFAALLGYTKQSMSNIVNSKQAVPMDMVNYLCTNFHVDPAWIIMGEEKVVTNQDIVLIEERAAAGYALGYAQPDYLAERKTIQLPGYKGDQYRAFEVYGKSMSPTLESGDIVIGRKVGTGEVRDNLVGVVVTREGLQVKRWLNRTSDPEKGYLMLKSDNREYDSMKVYPDEVIELYEVKARITFDLSGIPELYDRMNQLEKGLYDLTEVVGKLVHPSK